MCYRMSVIAAVATNESLELPPWERTIDQAKLDAWLEERDLDIDPEIWVFYQWDLMTGRPVSETPVTFEDIVDRFEVTYNRNLKKYKNMMGILNKLRTPTLFSSEKKIEDDPTGFKANFLIRII